MARHDKAREKRDGGPKVSRLDYFEAVPSVLEGERPAEYYDEITGMARAKAHLRAKALAGGYRLSPISVKYEHDGGRNAWRARYSCEVLGWAREEPQPAKRRADA